MSALSPKADIGTAQRCSGHDQGPRLLIILLRQPGVTLLIQLDRISQAFNQRTVTERLAQEADRSILERMGPVFVGWVCGNQNYRRVISPRLQGLLQVKTA